MPAALTADRLLIGLLQFDPVTDIDLERSLTNVRHALLHNAVSQAADNDAGDHMTEQLLDSACALAS